MSRINSKIKPKQETKNLHILPASLQIIVKITKPSITKQKNIIMLKKEFSIVIWSKQPMNDAD